MISYLKYGIFIYNKYMRIDLPGCGFRNCKYYFDGNCTDKVKYSDCKMSFLENYYYKSIENLYKTETHQALKSLMFEIKSELNKYISIVNRSVEENNTPFNRGKLDSYDDIFFILSQIEERLETNTN